MTQMQGWHPRVRVRVWRKPARRQTRGIGKKPVREQTRGCIFAPAPAPADFGRVSGARGSNNRYNKNVQIHQFKQSNNTFL